MQVIGVAIPTFLSNPVLLVALSVLPLDLLIVPQVLLLTLLMLPIMMPFALIVALKVLHVDDGCDGVIVAVHRMQSMFVVLVPTAY
jgi:hypothetical protein